MNEAVDILVAIRRITRAIDLQSKRLAKSTGLTAPQFVMMRTLAAEGPLPASVLAKDINLSQATVTSIADRLEKAGMITRSRVEKDRRVVTIALTDQGREKVAAIPDFFQESFLKELDKLEAWERTMMISSLQRIASMLSADELDASPILQVGDIQHHHR